MITQERTLPQHLPGMKNEQETCLLQTYMSLTSERSWSNPSHTFQNRNSAVGTVSGDSSFPEGSVVFLRSPTENRATPMFTIYVSICMYKHTLIQVNICPWSSITWCVFLFLHLFSTFLFLASRYGM